MEGGRERARKGREGENLFPEIYWRYLHMASGIGQGWPPQKNKAPQIEVTCLLLLHPLHPGLGVERVEKVLALVLDLLRLGGLPREPVLPHRCLDLRHVVLVLFGEFVHL